MIQEPLAITQSIQAALDAITSVCPPWKTREAAWNAFRNWSVKQGRDIPFSYEEKPLFYHQLQELFAFGMETAPSRIRKDFLKLYGRHFAAILFRERFPDFVQTSLASQDQVAPAIESLFKRFLKAYSGTLYHAALQRSAHRLSITLQYTDPDATNSYLRRHRLDPAECFHRSLLGMVGIIETTLESFLTPWDKKNLTHEIDGTRGVIHIRFPAGTAIHYTKLMHTLTEFTQQLQHRHSERLYSHDLEHDLILTSSFMREKWEKIKLSSATDEIILLRGEAGTGKTFLARRIHEMSARKDGPFVEVGLTADIGSDNFIQSHLFGHVRGAFTSAHEDKEGLFTLAESGTIFLDEIGDAGLDLQSKLLRVIERKTFKPLGATKDVTVDVRIIAATNKNLEDMVREGTFREDLYHRLNMIQIELPPLRDRAGEIPLLCDHFLKLVAIEVRKPPKALSEEAGQFLAVYAWPGNIREMIHVLKHALLFSRGETIATKDLPEYLAKSASPKGSRKAGRPYASSSTVINYDELCRLLGESDHTPHVKAHTVDLPWHIDHAKKLYLRALIHHFQGNLRKISSCWDRQSERALRALIKQYGLWDELEQARSQKSR